MIRVLHVIGAMNRAGAETFIMNVYRNIDRSKIQFDFLVHTDKPCDYDDEIRSLGGQIYPVPRFNGINYFAYRRVVAHFFSTHPEHDIVHGHIGSSASIYLREAKKYHKFTIAHSHATYGSFDIQQESFKVLSYTTRYIADYFFACSYEAGLDRFGKMVVNNKALFSVINNGIDIQAFIGSFKDHLAAKQTAGYKECVVFGSVGRLEAVKNTSLILEIFAEIRRKEPQSLLFLVGDGPLRADLESSAQKLGIREYVFFPGVVSNVKDYLKLMDVFILPSRYEGLGVALIEAQAAGLPCVVSDAIVDEAIITPYVDIVSLKESPSTWAQVCLDAAEKREAACRDNKDCLQNSGFDIKNVAVTLEAFYLEHS